jgi:hypothetical protein
MEIDFEKLLKILESSQDTLEELRERLALLDDTSEIREFDRVYLLMQTAELQEAIMKSMNRDILLAWDHEGMVSH